METYKIIHFLALALGVGGGFANLFLGTWAKSAAPEFKKTFGPLQGRLARLGFWSLIALWASGFAMLNAQEIGPDGLNSLFWWKIGAVAALTLLSGGMQLIAIGWLPASWAASPARRAKVSQIGSTLGLVIIVLAVLAFR